MASAQHRGLPVLDPPTRRDLRRWLAAHHRSTAGAWVVQRKGRGEGRGVTYEELVEEALCFGWIDSLAQPLDEQRHLLKLSPRRRGSPWSASNRGRVLRLTEGGLMMPAGLSAVEAARADGSWSALERAERLEEPEELRAALDVVPAARAAWDRFSPSSRRAILWWVISAKRPTTRERRIAEVVSEAAAGRRAQLDRAKRKADAD